MIPKLNRRIWILTCCYLTLICILNDLHFMSLDIGQSIYVLADIKIDSNNHNNQQQQQRQQQQDESSNENYQIEDYYFFNLNESDNNNLINLINYNNNNINVNNNNDKNNKINNGASDLILNRKIKGKKLPINYYDDDEDEGDDDENDDGKGNNDYGQNKLVERNRLKQHIPPSVSTPQQKSTINLSRQKKQQQHQQKFRYSTNKKLNNFSERQKRNLNLNENQNSSSSSLSSSVEFSQLFYHHQNQKNNKSLKEKQQQQQHHQKQNNNKSLPPLSTESSSLSVSDNKINPNLKILSSSSLSSTNDGKNNKNDINIRTVTKITTLTTTIPSFETHPLPAITTTSPSDTKPTIISATMTTTTSSTFTTNTPTLTSISSSPSLPSLSTSLRSSSSSSSSSSYSADSSSLLLSFSSSHPQTKNENNSNKNNKKVGDITKSESDISASENLNLNNNFINSNSQNNNNNNNINNNNSNSIKTTTTTIKSNKNSLNNKNSHQFAEEIEDQILANPELQHNQIIIITDEDMEQPSATLVDALDNGSRDDGAQQTDTGEDSDTDEDGFQGDEPQALPLRPIIREPDEDDHLGEVSIVYAEQHSSVKLFCEADLDIASSIWFKDGHMIHPADKNDRTVGADTRFIREPRGGLTINNVMLEDDGKWQCEAESTRGYVENARPTKLVVLDRPKPPYLLIDSRRLDAGNIFVPVKENSELSLACVSEGGNPKPSLTWEVLLSPGVDRHAQKVAAEVLELQEVKSDKNKEPYKINSGAISEAKLPAVYRAHHNARILCVMEHPTLKMRQNASLLLDVQYTPSFAISRTPGFGYPLREGLEVSLKCDVDSNPSSTPVWQKDDGEPPVPQSGDGYLNFTSIRREHSGWYKCTSKHLNFQYSSIGYYLSIRYDSVDVTSEPGEQDISMASHNPYKGGQIEVELGGTVTLQCPQGSLGCWSHLDPITARLKGLGAGLQTPTGQFSLKDVVYQDAGTYKCIGQSPTNKKKLEVIHSVGVAVKGHPSVVARNATPIAYPGSPLHLSVEFCANPPAFAARWLHGERIYTPGNQYGIDVLAYGVIDLPTPFCKEARLTYVHMHERVPRLFSFIVSSPGGVAEAIFRVNFTHKHKTMSNSVDEEEELSEPEEIHFPVFGSSTTPSSSSLFIHLIVCTKILFAFKLLLNYIINS